MSSGAYFRINRAKLRSMRLSDTSSGDETAGSKLGGISVTSSVERQAMREQLNTVRQTLDSLASGAQPNAAGVSTVAGPGLDGVLANIASKLNNIEGLYTSLADKLEKVDTRIEDSERNIKDLQHFSANTINETARLVDFVGGGRGSSPTTHSGIVAGGMIAGPSSRSRPYTATGMPSTPPHFAPSSSARSPLPALEYVPGHLSGTIQQHAAQIHKLIAGLDFLEAHIIRQDQVVEALQKQLLAVARDVASASPTGDSRAPSEVSVRVHDMEELVNKLRSHLFKVDKRSMSHDQALGTITSRIEALAGRIEVSEGCAGSGSRQEQAEGCEQAPLLSGLSAALEELRSQVLGLGRELYELRDQVQEQAQQQANGPSAQEVTDMQRQLSHLMSLVPKLVEENKSLKEFATHTTQQLSDLSTELAEQRQQQALSAAVQEQLASLEGRLHGLAPREELQNLSATVQARAPAAEVLAAEVASAARANLEEQFGQLRHRMELAAEAADAASKRSAESAAAAAAAVPAVEAAGQHAVLNAAAEIRERVVSMVAGVEQDQEALKEQFSSLAAHLSEEQAAITIGLNELQEQVTAATSAASDAVACAQQIHERQAASSQREQDAAESRQAELRDQVANVMEHLKERVEQAMQQMDVQVSALSEQLSSAIRAEHLEAALQEVRATAADSTERGELALVSMDEMRAELILLTGQQDVVQSRLQALEQAVGVDPQSNSPLESSRTRTATPRPDAYEDGSVRSPRPNSSYVVCASPGRRNGGLLDLVAELRARVGELEGAVAVAAGLQQATTRLIEDLEGLTATMDGINGRVALVATNYEAILGVSTSLQQRLVDQSATMDGLTVRADEQQARVEDVVARVQETSAAVSSLSARVARDYITREQLGAIFQARADIKRAVHVLGTVFDSGRLLREASMDDVETQVPSPSAESRNEGRVVTPRLASALEHLTDKQAELEHQVHLALYRLEGVVRQEQLAGVQQAMMTLEMQVRRQMSQQQQATNAANDAVIEGLCARVAALEASAAAAASVPAVPTWGSPSGGGVRLRLSQDDSGGEDSPVRVRLAVDEGDGDQQSLQPHALAAQMSEGAVAGTAEPEAPVEGAVGESEEPSLSQLLHAAAAPEASSADIQAAIAAAAEVQELRRTVEDLTAACEGWQSQLASESAERERLAEAVVELQERLDLQVNAMASTAAVVATLATDQQQRVRLQVRVAGPEAEDLAALSAAVSTLASRMEAAEDSLASAFLVRSPRSPTRTPGPVAAAEPGSAGSAEDEDGDGGAGGEDKVGPALGLMVPVLPRELEQQLTALQTELGKLGTEVGSLSGRLDGLEAAGALEEVRAAASEVVLEAIPGLVSQQVAAVRDEVAALVERQGESLVQIAGQSSRDAAEAVLAVREASAEAFAAREAAQDLFHEAVSAATEAALRAVKEAIAEEVAAALAVRGAGPMVHVDNELVAGVMQLKAETKEVQLAVTSLTERINDMDTLRDQLEALAEQIRSTAASDTGATAGGSQRPGTPNAAAVASIFTPAATAWVSSPSRTQSQHLGTSPPVSGAVGVRQAAPQASTNQQAAFLARLVDVVKRQSSRLHAQYTDAEETGLALAQVDHTLEEAEARLADVRDVNSPAFAETLVTVLEQVAALRYIGSQTHPAVQQMVLEHENRLDAVATQLKALSASAPAAAPAAAAAIVSDLAEVISTVSSRVARLETEVSLLTGQHAALDQAVTSMLSFAESVREQSASAVNTGSGNTSSACSEDNDGPVPAAEAAASAGGSSAAALEVAALSARVRLLDDSFSARLSVLRQEVLAEAVARSGAAASGSAAADVSALDGKVSQLHAAATAMRNRLLAVQEYVDSTQGMIKDMHVALGGLHRRVDAMEGTAGCNSNRVSGSGSSGPESSSLREVQSDLGQLQIKLLSVESSALEAAHALAGLKGLAPRVTEAENRLADVSSKLATALGGTSTAKALVIPPLGPGVSLPAVSSSLRALERRVNGRLEAACSSLDSFAGALSAAARIQAESTANPFKAISAAVNNPVVVALEKKVEALRAELHTVISTILEDLRRDQQASKASSLDVSVGSSSGHSYRS